MSRARKTTSALPPEEQLADYVGRLKRHRSGRIALHVKLSALSRVYRHDHHLRTAEGPLRDLLKQHQGQFFRLGNGDFVCIAKAPRAAFDAAILKIIYMMRDDPHLKSAIDAGEEDAFLCGWYELERDYDALCDLARNVVDGTLSSAVPDRAPAASPGPAPAPPRQGPPRGYVTLVREPKAASFKVPLDAEAMARLERALAGADLGRFLCRRPVYLIAGDDEPQAVMCDFGIDREAFARAVMPGYDLGAEPWFAARLRECLADRLIALAPSPEAGGLLAVLFRSSLRSVASAEFARFVEGLDRRTRRSLVISLPAIEAFANPLGYWRARNGLISRGLRCALMGFDPLSLVLVDRDFLPADFMALDARCLMAWDAGEEDCYPALCGRIRSLDPARLILEHCADEDAVARGQRLGIRLFSGPWLER